MPTRVRLQRTKGWRKPEGAIVVARPSRWGNPLRLGERGLPDPAADRAAVMADFRRGLLQALEDPSSAPAAFVRIAQGLPELRGHDLACWCPLDQPCHADVLLELANGPAARG